MHQIGQHEVPLRSLYRTLRLSCSTTAVRRLLIDRYRLPLCIHIWAIESTNITILLQETFCVHNTMEHALNM